MCVCVCAYINSLICIASYESGFVLALYAQHFLLAVCCSWSAIYDNFIYTQLELSRILLQHLFPDPPSGTHLPALQLQQLAIQCTRKGVNSNQLPEDVRSGA